MGRSVDLASGACTYNAQRDTLDVYARKKLPGVVILVHGVNSDGEWYHQTEAGLCVGLTTRLRRGDAHVEVPSEVGQLAAAAYRGELTERGFIDRKLNRSTFIKPEASYSPVIRFRWGYRANMTDKYKYGANVWLNEQDAWGGGPFANGCSSIADCWSDGVNDELFAWLTVQDLNPVPSREVFRCPPRSYQAHAAWRLARLIALIRERQDDVPITVVCHSQGNMVAIASTFVGEQALGGQGVADTYLLFNPPYNLSLPDFMARYSDNRVQAHLGGRVTEAARFNVFKKFLAIVRSRRGKRQCAEDVDFLSGNPAPKDGATPFTMAEEDKHERNNHGRVILNCNPHDQVISAMPVQGIGWKGVSAEQITRLEGQQVFYQRVWAAGSAEGRPWRVGDATCSRFDFWRNHWSAQARADRKSFWHPPSPQVRFVWRAALDDPQRSKAQAAGATLLGVIASPFLFMLGATVNASPPKEWEIPVTAPAVPEPIVPQAPGGGFFDTGKDPEHANLATTSAVSDPFDPYNRARDGELKPLAQEMKGDSDTEAQLRYEHHARIRRSARRQSSADAEAADRLDGTDAQAEQHLRDQGYDRKRIEFLMQGRDNNATDHSTILSHPMHAEKVIAYDVAVGYSVLSDEDWRMLREVADWRWIDTEKPIGESKEFVEYFAEGFISRTPLENHPNYRPSALPGLQIDSAREMNTTHAQARSLAV